MRSRAQRTYCGLASTERTLPSAISPESCIAFGEPELAVAELFGEVREARQPLRRERAAENQPDGHAVGPSYAGKCLRTRRTSLFSCSDTTRPSRTRMTSTPWFSHRSPSRVVA